VLVLDARRPLEAESNPDVAKEPKSDRHDHLVDATVEPLSG
jgi:hypothetical protein